MQTQQQKQQQQQQQQQQLHMQQQAQPQHVAVPVAVMQEPQALAEEADAAENCSKIMFVMGFCIPLLGLINMCMHCGSPHPPARYWAKGSAIQFAMHLIVIVVIIALAAVRDDLVTAPVASFYFKPGSLGSCPCFECDGDFNCIGHAGEQCKRCSAGSPSTCVKDGCYTTAQVTCDCTNGGSSSSSSSSSSTVTKKVGSSKAASAQFTCDRCSSCSVVNTCGTCTSSSCGYACGDRFAFTYGSTTDVTVRRTDKPSSGSSRASLADGWGVDLVVSCTSGGLTPALNKDI